MASLSSWSALGEGWKLPHRFLPASTPQTWNPKRVCPKRSLLCKRCMTSGSMLFWGGGNSLVSCSKFLKTHTFCLEPLFNTQGVRRCYQTSAAKVSLQKNKARFGIPWSGTEEVVCFRKKLCALAQGNGSRDPGHSSTLGTETCDHFLLVALVRRPKLQQGPV